MVFGLTMEKNKFNRNKNEYVEDESVIVGRNPVLELLKSDRGIEKLYILRGEREGSITKIYAEAKNRKIPVVETDKKKLDELAGPNSHQGVAAIAAVKEYASIADIIEIAKSKGEKPLIVVCDGIEDPHNIGALIRCVDGLGAHGIIIGKRHSAVIGQSVYKASAGAAEHVAIAKVPNIASAIDELKEAGIWTFCAEADGENIYRTDMKCAAAIVLGSEGFGVSRLVREKCDFTISIPMKGIVNSFNVSTAGAMILSEAVRQRSNQ